MQRPGYINKMAEVAPASQRHHEISNRHADFMVTVVSHEIMYAAYATYVSHEKCQGIRLLVTPLKFGNGQVILPHSS